MSRGQNRDQASTKRSAGRPWKWGAQRGRKYGPIRNGERTYAAAWYWALCEQ